MLTEVCGGWQDLSCMEIGKVCACSLMSAAAGKKAMELPLCVAGMARSEPPWRWRNEFIYFIWPISTCSNTRASTGQKPSSIYCHKKATTGFCLPLV